LGVRAGAGGSESGDGRRTERCFQRAADGGFHEFSCLCQKSEAREPFSGPWIA
jgi:hypothetical protein